MYRYYFKRRVESPADMPKLLEKWCIYDKPLYTPQYERDTWGWAEYDHPLQQGGAAVCYEGVRTWKSGLIAKKDSRKLGDG